MGLDMYAFAVALDKLNDTEKEMSADVQIRNAEEICYWRKHHDLHGWMHRLYITKGGKSSEFNCNTLRLTMQDLVALESAIVTNQLPQTTGFFFGDNPPDEESKQYDLEFVKKAREYIKDGYAVFYDSWW